MVRRFSWCTAVALAVLLFVTTEGLRERGAQADDHKAANRGTLKYNSKSLEEATTASSASSLSRSRANRDRSAQSRRFSNIEGATQASTINSESSSSEPSIAKITTGITERNGRSTAIEVADESSGKTSDKKIEEVRKTEPAVNRRNGKRYFPENDEETRSKNNEQRVSVETSRGTSRRTSNGRSNSSRVTERLDNKGPSVFLATTEPSRSRTGRKIQTTYSKKDLKTQISTSRRHSNKKFEDDFTTTSYRRGRSTTERIERSTRSGRSRANNTENDSVTRRGPDTLLSESESVRVDIPLVVNGNPVSSSVTNESAQRRSDTKEPSRSGRTGSERSKNRGRSNDSEVAGSSRGSSGSRRGSSKFGDSTTTTEANEQVVGSRRSTISRDRSRSSETGKKNSVTESRSRSRGRNLENNVKSGSNDAPERDAKRKVAGERSPSERRSRVLDGVSRVVESRGQDSQDLRGKSRNRSRSDVVRPLATDVTTTVAPETTVDVTTIDSEVTTVRPATPTTTSSSRSTSRPSPTSTSTTEASGRGRGRGRGGRKQKEDFFNYGLGFRGRKPSPEGSSNATQPRKTILWKNDTPINGNPGWTLRRRPGHFNNTANPSRTIVPSSRDQTNEVIPPNEESTSTEVATTTTESSTTSSSRRGFKKLQTIDESSTVAGTTVKSYRRGNKTFGNGKATAEREESDNYPPEFKARLTQLKNINTKIPAPKTTSRTQLEEQEWRIYGRRSRNNSMAFEPDDLETAASANVLTDESLIVNPLTLINGRGLRRYSEIVARARYEPNGGLDRLVSTLPQAPILHVGKYRPRAMSSSPNRTGTVLRSPTCQFPLELPEPALVSTAIFHYLKTELFERPFQVKKSSAALFAERSRMKLDLARRLVKPELNIEENDLDATTASSFSKPRPTGGVPVLDETSKVAEHGKPAATASGGRSNRPSTSVESSREEVNAKSSRKDHEDSSKVTGRPNGLKKGRIIAERMVTSISIEERTAIEETTKPYVLSTNPSVIPPVEQGSETAADSTRIRQSGGRAGKKSKEEDSTIKNMKVSLYSTRRTETGDHVTTVKPKKPYVYQSRNTKFQLREQSTAMEQSSTTPSPKKPYAPTHRKSQTSQQDGVAKKTKFSNSAGKPMFRPRYSKRAKEKSSLDEKKTNDEDTITTKVPVPTSRYSRKKSLVKSIDDGSITTERSATQTKKLEFRPRTATYRRHSEIPTTFVESSTKVDKRAGVAITPRSTKYHATLKSTTASPRSVAQEPRVSLKIANESTSGIIDSSNGDTGNSNIFNPTRSTFLGGNNTLLEQLRSTVAPLLSSLGNKTPVFSESYSNVNNANSPSRITPSGQPPRFSARYKGAELFVRKQNNIYQPTVPSITSSSTTPVTPVENSGSAPPIDISSPGEPRFLTLYQALESASIRNEQLLRNASVQLQEQSDRVSQVDSNATAIANVIGDNANNDTTSPTVATVSPQTPDTIANTTQDSTQTPRFEDPENSTPAVTTRVPETPTTTDSVFTSAEPSSSTEQASTSAEPSSSTEQASTSAEPFSSTEQASTSAESLSSTEQISTSTDSSSTLEQFSVKIGSVPVTEPASTESSSQAADETTMNVTDAEDVRNSTSDNDSTNQELVSSTTDASTTSSVSEASSTELDGDVSENTTETTTITNMATTSENPEINTIPVSDVTVTQIANISSTDASTTEMDSNDVETTTTTSTSTIRTRLIDFAEDILSRLQATMSTTMQPSRDSTTTMQPSRDSTTTLPSAIDTEISNVVSDSNGNRSLESMSQLRDETTTSQGVTTDQSSLGTTEEVTTQNAVGSITTSSSTMVPSPEVSTQDELNAFTSTTPATITTTTATQDSQTVSNTDSTTVSDSNDSSSPTLNVEVTTASIVTSTNDTLLTELMSIAKTLLSEEINDTQEATAGQNSNVTSKLGDTMENEIDRPSLSNDVLSTTQATETSFVPLGVTTESVDSTSTTVVPPKSSTFFVDTPQNEDTTSTTAQRTAGSRIGQTTEISTPTIPDSSTTPSLFTEPPTSFIGRVPDGGTSTPQTTRMDVVTVTPLTETTTTTTVNIEENLVSTETTTSTSPASSDSTTAMPTFTSTPGGVPTEATTMSVQTTPATTETTASPQSRLTFQSATTPYLEDNLIDARNVDSPYVIFGIFPDGRLVRKFPNGTIIPDPPRRPVEVVFTLSTSTTTNRPLPRPYYNQANQGTYNRGPVYDYNGRPVAETMRNAQTPGTIDARLSGNAIVGPNGGGPDNTGPLGTPASLPSINEMSNALLNTQMGTASVTPIVSTGRPPTDSQGGRIVQDRERDEATRTKEAGGQRSSVYIGQDKFVNYWTDGASTSNPRVLGVNVNSVATATNEGPSPAVPSFENLLNNQPDRQVTAPPGFPWRDPLDQIFGITTSSPVITASVASNTLDDSSEPNPIAARPINPFVEVFTPFSNVIGVPKVNIGSIPPPPPPSSTTPTPTTSTTTTTMAPTTTTTMAPTTTTTMAPTTTTTMAPTTTTTMAPTTTTTMAPTTTTTMAPTTTTTMAPTTITTMAPTISTTTARTTTPEPATTAQRANIASQVRTSGTATSSQTNSSDLRKNSQQQNTFGTTFDDLVFLNSLLQSNSRSTTQKTLTQVEQLLANKILELALKNPGPTRSPKAINIEKLPANSIYQSPTKSPSEPIIIELSPSSATSTPTWKSVETIPSSTTIKTTLISTTKAPVTVKAKPATTPRPKTTTQAPLGFAGLLWQTLLGGNIFGPSTIPKPTKAKPVPKTTQKAVNITPKPLQTTKKIETTTIPSTTTLKAVDISKIHVSSPNSIINEKSVTTPRPISTTDQPLINNPNPRLPNVVTSTYSPEDDAKFLVELLRAVEQDNKIGSSKKKTSSLTRDDEAFLRAILSGRALVTPPPAPTSTTEVSNAALLAALLKAQGIQPSTPANNIREQLQLASLGQSVTSTPTTSPASESTTITTRPASTAANRPTDTTKKSVTPRPTSGPRIRTTTWSPSSTYPPSLFSSFGIPVQSVDNNSGNSALVGATRAFSQFLGAAISGAAQQLQSLVRNGTRIVSEVARGRFYVVAVKQQQQQQQQQRQQKNKKMQEEEEKKEEE
ncbi:hypothetical protein WN51_14185 [Melipona quadrifasciata]|uniref:Uncharacterized protein n=1 Tax=Melipona quadrifasciata TaxID=166423 RepID=A0A0M8ZZ68_9HYME|nr:hypothetical protein WN51_14185 [Melipona quadrifasciata]